MPADFLSVSIMSGDTLARNKVSRGFWWSRAEWRGKRESYITPEAEGMACLWATIVLPKLYLLLSLRRIVVKIVWNVTTSLASHWKDRKCVSHSIEQVPWIEDILEGLGYTELHWEPWLRLYYWECCVFFNICSRFCTKYFQKISNNLKIVFHATWDIT